MAVDGSSDAFKFTAREIQKVTDLNCSNTLHQYYYCTENNFNCQNYLQ